MILYPTQITALVCSAFLLSSATSRAEEPASSSHMKSNSATGQLTLVKNGQSDYIIALASDAIPAERTAANELQSYLKQITGATLPVKSDDEVALDTPQIIVGAGNRAKQVLSPQVWDALGNDTIIIKTQGNNLILSGSRPRGTLYAVYQFLEESAGVRWWTPRESTVPQKKTLAVPARDVVYTPPFGYREYYTDSVQNDALFATRMKENGDHQPQDASLGGHYNLIGFVHTFQRLMPLEKYFKEHPEWYSDPTNGNKPCTPDSPMPIGGDWQLNLTDDAMRQEFTKNVFAYVREHPTAGMISVSQNDNDNYCRSEGDMAIIEREGAPSGALIDFVNKVAADVEAVDPSFLVETLAYEYSVKPPKTVKPRHNVIIRICPIGDIARPIDSADNQKLRDIIESWRAISPHLYIWDYVTNFSQGMMPHPNLRTSAPNLRYFARSNVFGVFQQGDCYTNSVGDFVQLRTWLSSQLMWNPELDDSKLIDEFLKGYYGAAAPHLRAYLDLIQSSFLKTGLPLGMYSNEHSYLTLDVMNQAWSHFQKAQKAVANDPIFSKRVRRERLSLDTAIINRSQNLRREAAAGKAAPVLPTNMKHFVEDYIATAKSFEVRAYSERQTFDAYAAQARGRAVSAAPLPEPLRSELTPKQKAQEVIDLKDHDFFYTAWSHQEVDDAAASNGKASRFSGKSKAEIVLRYCMQESNQPKPQTWDAYARVRVEASADADFTKPAFAAGVYDLTSKKSHITQNIDFAPLADGKYHLIKLGTWTIDNGQFVWITPIGREDIPFVFVDRMILVRKQ